MATSVTSRYNVHRICNCSGMMMLNLDEMLGTPMRIFTTRLYLTGRPFQNLITPSSVSSLKRMNRKETAFCVLASLHFH